MSDSDSDSSEELSELSEDSSLDIESELDADLAKEEKKDNKSSKGNNLGLKVGVGAAVALGAAALAVSWYTAGQQEAFDELMTKKRKLDLAPRLTAQAEPPRQEQPPVPQPPQPPVEPVEPVVEKTPVVVEPVEPVTEKPTTEKPTAEQPQPEKPKQLLEELVRETDKEINNNIQQAKKLFEDGIEDVAIAINAKQLMYKVNPRAAASRNHNLHIDNIHELRKADNILSKLLEDYEKLDEKIKNELSIGDQSKAKNLHLKVKEFHHDYMKAVYTGLALQLAERRFPGWQNQYTGTFGNALAVDGIDWEFEQFIDHHPYVKAGILFPKHKDDYRLLRVAILDAYQEDALVDKLNNAYTFYESGGIDKDDKKNAKMALAKLDEVKKHLNAMEKNIKAAHDYKKVSKEFKENQWEKGIAEWEANFGKIKSRYQSLHDRIEKDVAELKKDKGNKTIFDEGRIDHLVTKITSKEPKSFDEKGNKVAGLIWQREYDEALKAHRNLVEAAKQKYGIRNWKQKLESEHGYGLTASKIKQHRRDKRLVDGYFNQLLKIGELNTADKNTDRYVKTTQNYANRHFKKDSSTKAMLDDILGIDQAKLPQDKMKRKEIIAKSLASVLVNHYYNREFEREMSVVARNRIAATIAGVFNKLYVQGWRDLGHLKYTESEDGKPLPAKWRGVITTAVATALTLWGGIEGYNAITETTPKTPPTIFGGPQDFGNGGK